MTTNLDLSDLRSRDSDGSHVSRDTVRAIEAYLPELLLALELNYWRVYVAKDMPPENALLMIEPTDGRRVAMLYVSEAWADRNPEEKRTDLTHECLHLAHHDQEEVFRRFKDRQGDTGTYPMSIVWDQFKVETERMVDSLSYVLAPFMPAWTEPARESEPAADR